MAKWILTVDNETFEFDNFSDAVTMLKAEISKHMEVNEDIFGREGEPFTPDTFLSSKYDEGTISDEEIVVQTRMSMLCRSFIWRGADYSKDNALKSLKGDIHYYGKNEHEEELKIDIHSSKDEVVLDITHYDGIEDETYMRSNAFIFDDSNKKYYFNSYQIVTTTSNEKDLGKIVNINISLEPVEYDSADDFVVREYRKYARLDKNTKITEIDEWALNKVSAENNYDVHELRELLLNGHK